MNNTTAVSRLSLDRKLHAWLGKHLEEVRRGGLMGMIWMVKERRISHMGNVGKESVSRGTKRKVY